MENEQIPGHEEFSNAIATVALCWAIAFLMLLAFCSTGHAQATAYLPPPEKFCRFDANGNPLVGGLLYTYSAGTTTNKTTYKDSQRASSNANPVVLDSSGCADVWFASGGYKLKLTDSLGTLLWTVDNVVASSTTWGSITGTLSNQTDLWNYLQTLMPLSYLDTDVSLSANSNVRVPSQKAVKTYAVPTTRKINATAPLTIGGGASADLSADRTIAISVFTGDSGSGGAAGSVPGPATGDASNNKYLRADGTWAPLVSGGAGIRKGRITAVCTTGSSSYSQCASDMSLNWSVAFADTNYTVTCTGITPSNGRSGPIFITSKSTSGINVNFPTEGSVAVTYAEIDCIAIP